MTQPLNNDKDSNPNEKYQMGDEIEVKIIEAETDRGFVLTVPVEELTQPKAKVPKTQGKLEVGALIRGQIKSIKG